MSKPRHGDEPTIVCPHCDGTGRLLVKRAHIGDMIVVRRKAKGMTQEQLAAKVGKSRPQIANIESGRSDMPTKTLAVFAEALGCTMKDLVP